MKKHLLILLMAIAAITANAQTKQQADSIYEASRDLVNNSQVEKCRPLALQAMEMYKKLCGEICDDYINALNVYAVSFGQEKNFKKAAELELQVIRLCEQLDHQHPRIGLFYENMGYYAYMIDDYKNSTKYWDLALPYEEKYSDKYGTMIQGMAMMYEELGDFDNLSRMMQLMDDHNRHELSLPCEELKCMLERGEYFSGTGDYSQAKEWYLKAIGIAENEGKIQVYEAYGQFLAMTMKEYAQGAEYTLSAANMKKELYGESEDYAVLMYKAGQYSFLGKQFQQAVDCYDQALEFFNKYNTSAAQSNQAKCLKGMGNAYSGLKEYGKAIECFQQVVTYYATNDPENEEYPKNILRLAKAEKSNKDYEASIAHHQQAMELFEARGMLEDYSDAANSLQLCYAYAGIQIDVDTKEDAVKAQRNAKLDQIIKEELDNLQMTHDYLGLLIYAQSLGTIAGCYSLKEEYPESINYYKQYIGAIREALQSEFSMQSENERMSTWGQEKGNMQELKEMLVGLPDGNESLKNDLAALVYDVALLSKGILLNSSIEFEKVLAEQGNEQLKTVYAQIKANEERMEWLRENAASDADLNTILHLSQENQALQIQLYKGCKELADFTDYISYDWKAVQQTLAPTDVAIEFTTINPVVKNSDDIMMALVLTKDMEAPVAITIWKNENLAECVKTDFYKSLSDTIIYHGIRNEHDVKYLEKAQSRLDDISTSYKSELSLFIQYTITKMKTDKAYLAMPLLELMKYNQLFNNDVFYDTPAGGNIVWGTLSQYLEGKNRIYFSADGCFNHIAIEYLQFNGKPLSEQFKVYRLSSTKELCYHHQAVPMDRIALFGDINYNDEATVSQATQSGLFAMRGQSNLFDNLDNTKREINEIQALLHSSGAKAITKLTGTEASTTAFLALNDSQVNLIHIATHGVYRDSVASTETESMSNSLLVFAGANLKGDAVVTAADIAKMNLRRCDLAVLSACETGLGKLSDDGVFGLQRGFKNAGVHALLMSLKNVHDEATADLMISFYTHLIEGMTKREALVKAQQEIRESGYKDAKYWATFILLDALE